MQPRISVRAEPTYIIEQARNEWIEVPGYNAGMFRVEIHTLTDGTLRLMTSVTDDENSFEPLVGYTASGYATLVATPHNTGLVPLMRYVKWNFSAGAGTSVCTFRIVAQFKNL